MPPLSAQPPVQPVTRLDTHDLQLLEDYRLKALKARRDRWAVSAVVLPVVVYAAARFAENPELALWKNVHFYLLVGMAAFILFRWVGGVRRQYVEDYKETVLPMVAAAFNFRYLRSGGVPLSKVTDAAIIPPYTNIKTEDLFSGDYKGAAVHVSELDLWQRYETMDNKEREKEVFSGLAILVELPRVAFSGQTAVFPRNQTISAALQGKLRKLQHVDMVDPYFEKKYRAYGTDQIESRFVLHPAMVERIERLDHPLVPGKVSVAFINGCVLVLVPIRQNLFEPPALAIPATDADSIRMLEHELQQALGLVDAFEFYRPQPR